MSTHTESAATRALDPRIVPGAILAGGALAVIGSFMNWAKVITAFGGPSVNGVDGDAGKLTAFLGLVILGVGVFAWRQAPAKWMLVVSILAGAVVAFEAIYKWHDLASANLGTSAATLTIGVGLPITTAGGLVAVAAGILGFLPLANRAR